MGPTTGIIISSPKLVREYMDLRGSITSDRPRVYVDKLISNNLELPLTPYGKRRDVSYKLLRFTIVPPRPRSCLEKYEKGSA